MTKDVPMLCDMVQASRAHLSTLQSQCMLGGTVRRAACGFARGHTAAHIVERRPPLRPVPGCCN